MWREPYFSTAPPPSRAGERHVASLLARSRLIGTILAGFVHRVASVAAAGAASVDVGSTAMSPSKKNANRQLRARKEAGAQSVPWRLLALFLPCEVRIQWTTWTGWSFTRGKKLSSDCSLFAQADTPTSQAIPARLLRVLDPPACYSLMARRGRARRRLGGNHRPGGQRAR